MPAIRPMTELDIPAADSILQAAHRMEVSFARLLALNLKFTPHSWWLLENENSPIGLVGSTDYTTFSHIGLMAIHPDHQVCGSGALLLNHAIASIESAGQTSITLYSTDAGLAFYPRYGFRWAGLSTEWQLRKQTSHSPLHRVFTASNVSEIAEWDRNIFGGNREPLLSALAKELPDRILTVQDENGTILGFLVAQPAVIGPFAAATPQAATDLLHAALSLDFAQPPRVILPDAHAQGENLLISCGFTPLRTSRYFTRGTPPNQQRTKMYGQAAYSLG